VFGGRLERSGRAMSDGLVVVLTAALLVLLLAALWMIHSGVRNKNGVPMETLGREGMGEYVALTLPESRPESHVALLVKRYRYIGITLVSQEPGASNESVFTCHLHQVEARKLAKALLEVAEWPVRDDFVDEGCLATEGVFLGGPPRKEQLVEFNPHLLRSAAPKS
jgi:hypothetical protein